METLNQLQFYCRFCETLVNRSSHATLQLIQKIPVVSVKNTRQTQTEEMLVTW